MATMATMKAMQLLYLPYCGAPLVSAGGGEDAEYFAAAAKDKNLVVVTHIAGKVLCYERLLLCLRALGWSLWGTLQFAQKSFPETPNQSAR